MSRRPDELSPRTSGSSVNYLLVGCVAVLTGLVIFQFVSPRSFRTRPESVPVREVTPKGEPGADEQATISVFRRASPSVVFIRTKGYQPYYFGRVQEKELSSGTGFVWDTQGHIVTNLHVVLDSLQNTNSALEVEFEDGTVADAQVLGGVREHDIAVIRIDPGVETLHPITLGTSDDLEVGQTVLAIGNPFGFGQTLSTGVIGGLNRSIAREESEGILEGLIQTDAAINPGNSGGPLLDSSGRMIGVNTAIVSPTGAYSGLGFAVPVSSIMSSVQTVLQGTAGKQQPVLGITLLSLTAEDADRLQLPDQVLKRGLFIKDVDPTGPVANTDLRPTRQVGYVIYLGDQLAAINGSPVTTADDLKRELDKYSPGDRVTLDVYRGNQLGSIQVTLQARKLIF
ncbi:MAG: trypsin-like peptidase domain-containing protein [Planctomycetaceae bacterium]